MRLLHAIPIAFLVVAILVTIIALIGLGVDALRHALRERREQP